MSEIRASLIGIVGGAALFGFLCFVFDAPSAAHFGWATATGAFTGLLAAAEFSPESYRWPKTFQVLSGGAAGLCAGLFLEAPLPFLLLLVGIGILVGYFAKSFVEGVYVP